MISEHYQKLCIKAICDKLSDEEQNNLNLWLQESASHKDEFENLKNLISNIDLADNTVIPDIDTHWNILKDRIDSYEHKPYKKPYSYKTRHLFSKFFRPVYKPALTGAFLLIIALTVLFSLKNETRPPSIKLITTQNTERTEIKLPDASIAYLNSGSSIRFSETFDDSIREIYLTGEAFFKVTKNSKPFIVITDNAKTKVLGTQFNVWAREGETRVIVKEGCVNLSSKVNPGESINLLKGNSSSVIKDGPPLIPRNVDPEKILGWMEGRLIFDGAELGEITDELNRKFNINISLEDKRLNSIRMSAAFENSSIDSVLSMICLALDLQYSEYNGGYIIKSPKSVKE